MHGFLFTGILLALAAFWVVQFLQLMLMEDDLFPGRFDKPLWVAAFIFAPPLAPFAFLMWKYARSGQRSSGG
jgi:hypothetical protein